MFSLDLACYLYILRVLNIFKGEVICRFINNPDNEIGTSLINKIKKSLMLHLNIPATMKEIWYY